MEGGESTTLQRCGDAMNGWLKSSSARGDAGRVTPTRAHMRDGRRRVLQRLGSTSRTPRHAQVNLSRILARREGVENTNTHILYSTRSAQSQVRNHRPPFEERPQKKSIPPVSIASSHNPRAAGMRIQRQSEHHTRMRRDAPTEVERNVGSTIKVACKVEKKKDR